jgi:hypothetical protein
MVVVVIYRCWLIGRCQSIVGRCWGELPPFFRSRILIILVVLIIYIITIIRVFGLGNFVADLFICVRVPLLLSLFSHQLFFP